MISNLFAELTLKINDAFISILFEISIFEGTKKHKYLDYEKNNVKF
jgi:hypothetical protein